MRKHRIINLLTVLLMVLALAACGEPEPIESPPMNPSSDPLVVSDASVYEQITYLVCTGDPAAYIVYVITPDRITTYDFTKYWMNATGGYQYFDDEMPDEDEYSSQWIDLSPEGWERIVGSVIYNEFEKLPEDMSVDGIYDGATYYIEVKTEDGTHLSGGYGAGDGRGKKHERYYNVVAAINEVIRDSEEEAKEKWALFTEPQGPASQNIPATAETFELISERADFEELEYLFGPYDEIDERTVPRWFGWELEEGGTAWVSFGAESIVSDIMIDHDDHCEFVISSLKGVICGPDEIYEVRNTDDLTADEEKLFRVVSMMIRHEIGAGSSGNPDPLNDFMAVMSFGEEIGSGEPEILGGYAGSSAWRMPVKDLQTFYREVFGEEREYEPDFETGFDPAGLPEIGVVCLDDGYCYSYCGCGYEEHAEVRSVLQSSSVCVVYADIVNDLSDDPNGDVTASVRFVMNLKDGVYGHELIDFVYTYAS